MIAQKICIERIIPTRVGTRLPTVVFKPCVRNHPHACGDKALLLCVLLLGSGSSPRVWGQAHRSSFENFLQGIIPTRMGTSLGDVFFADKTRNHPHAYGDKSSLTSWSMCFAGSSPRVWGQEDILWVRPYLIRIIPTRMGTSLYLYPTHFQASNHPHAYGDKLSP